MVGNGASPTPTPKITLLISVTSWEFDKSMTKVCKLGTDEPLVHVVTNTDWSVWLCAAFTCSFPVWISGGKHGATSTPGGHLSSAGCCFCSDPQYSLETLKQCQPVIHSPSALWCHPVCHAPTGCPLLEGTAKALHCDRQNKNNNSDKTNKMN